MTPLAQIEAAAKTLPPQEMRELFLFLAEELRASGVEMPEPRDFDLELIESWTAEDEAAMRRFKENKKFS